VKRTYESSEGFSIHWDYILGLPKRTQFSQEVYAIYCGGETVYTPKFIE